MNDKQDEHAGTRSRYVHGCRCVPCTRANTAYMGAYRARRIDAGEGRYVHGRLTTVPRRWARPDSVSTRYRDVA